MLSKLRSIRPDALIIMLITAVITAIIIPARGDFADWFATGTKWAVALLFYLYGARLSTTEAIAGLKHWRLHVLILTCTFVLFPLFGLALFPLKFLLGDGLYLGILYLCLVPSTVQASIAFTSIAGGNVAGAIVSASLSSIVGVLATPLLAMVLMGGGHVEISSGIFINIAIQLFLPFLAGQLTRRWVGTFAAKPATKWLDKFSVMMIVYSAFSASVVQGVWTSVSAWQVVALVGVAAIMVVFMLWGTDTLAARLGFNRADRITIQFCGAKKSLAAGLPMAIIIFGAGSLGLLMLPLMVFH
ncbi:MAG: bile acid:sodium symporter family protein, partial [Rothia sp. (in: high G+C Gram-positive bacteria)]|uniref:bile acid:sodium symporter family protein n=1 Tax=Rothia sp. (in: high G+C Gram-positive bacteria) TaxID=1885016 RepID=UPI0026E03AA7